ncbi:MAG: electron transfer flavoprotein subunit alpha/FixB family protein [Desulfurococcales archaeon]|nr:electron transfer flavoprotein subunit alpha/FixB family protein [Desulfurococcales archaeon]MCE4605305.1 electron transfer flavoprotein subunit alpha/FixB family protein [Desulfurococcales archaeon]
MRTLIVAEYVRDALESVRAAKTLGSDKVLLLAFGPTALEAENLSGLVDKVYALSSRNPESVYNSLRSIYEEEEPGLIIGVVSKNVKDALSRLAGAYDLPMSTEVVEVSVEGDSVKYRRGILSERAYSVEKVPMPAIILLNPRVFEPEEAKPGGEVVKLEEGNTRVKSIGISRKQLSGVKLEEAEIVVGVGRGFKKKEDLKLAFDLAELLGGQVGGSRPIAADFKWLPEDAWIGISGKRISPKLYMAIGISGAPQHMSAVMGSKVIVAVNKDKNAPIFKQADYGVVADLYQFLPILIKKIRERKG